MRSAAFLLTFVYAAGLGAQPAPLEGFDDYARKTVREFGVQGLAIAVVKDDKVVFEKGYGKRKAGGEDVGENTIFAIASLSKAFTTATAGILVDEKKLAWDDPVVKHLPWFQLYDPWVTREITVRDLLCHRSGLPAYGGDLFSFGSPLARTAVVERLRYLKPAASFRSRYAYQNNMFVTAGEVIRAAAGSTWDDLVQTRIFAPLGMKSSSTSIAGLPKNGDVATPHTKIGAEYKAVAWTNYDTIGAAGAINSTVHDMAQWMRLQLNGGEYEGKRIFSAETARTMWSAHTPIPIAPPLPETRTPQPKFSAYGLGWSLVEYQGRKLATHSGGVTGMTSRIVLVPAEKLGVVILTNSEVPMQWALAYRVIDAYLKLPPTDWSAVYQDVLKRSTAREQGEREKIDQARVRDTKPSLAPAGYAGAYRDSMLGAVRIEEAGGRLAIRIDALMPVAEGALEHWHFDTFRIAWKDPTWPKTFVTFRLNAKGQVEDAALERAEPGDPSYDFENYVLVRAANERK